MFNSAFINTAHLKTKLRTITRGIHELDDRLENGSWPVTIFWGIECESYSWNKDRQILMYELCEKANLSILYNKMLAHFTINRGSIVKWGRKANNVNK